MKKRFLALALALALVLSMTGCGSTPAESTPSETTTPAESTPSDAPVDEVYTSLDDFVLVDDNGVLLKTGRDDTGEQGVVSSGKYEASKIGVEIIEQGGNAVDAAVAVGFALGLAEPNSSGLGGGGFMTLYIAETDETVFLDFRERAPAAATPSMWELDADGKVLRDEKKIGGKASGVPGEVAGLLYALEHYGTMDRATVIQPTIDLAKAGITVSPTLAADMLNSVGKFAPFPESQELFFKDVDGMKLPYETGDNFVNEDYAKTLQIIADQGFDGFYKGEVAEAIVEATNRYDGLFTMEDMAGYEVNVLEPITGTYRDYEIISAPPPSSGGTIVIEILNILENFDLASMEDNSAEELHLFSEAFKLAYADRGEYMGDTAYVDVPLGGLTSKEYAKKLAGKISPDVAMEVALPDDPWMYEGEDTTHFSVADAEGNIVAVTQTVNYVFGNGVSVGGYGFVMNNEMDDFVAYADHPNSIIGGKTPLSSMTPTIILDPEGKAFATLGSPGGTTIISTVAQVISNLIDHDMTVQAAIDAPRISGFKDNTISYEGRITDEVIAELEAMGRTANAAEDWNRGHGSVNAIMYGDDGLLYGGADPRRDSKAIGY